MENESVDEKPKKTGREIGNANLKPFGSANGNPQSQNAGGNKPWSIRNSLRYMAHAEIDGCPEKNEDDDKLTEREAEHKIMRKVLPKKHTVAQAIAARQLAKAIRGDHSAASFSTEQIDGKLAQTNINAAFNDLLGMSDDELERIANGTDVAATPGSGAGGTPTPGRSTGDADAPGEPTGEAGATTGV